MTISRALFLSSVAGLLFFSRAASAEVSIVKSGDWEVYTSGRVGAFGVYGTGDANPVPLNAGESIRPGGGLDVASDFVSGAQEPDPNNPGMTRAGQGSFTSWRIRSGFVPNVLAFGLRTHITENTQLTAYIGLWMPIGTEKQRKTGTTFPDAREGYVKVEGPAGSLLAGRALDLFSRGATENDFLYGHGYSVGYPGNINNVGNTNGLIGFGVLAAFFTPGIVYTTPMIGGLQLSIGAYDPAAVPGTYEATRYPMGESELTFDLRGSAFNLHLFGNGAIQKLYSPGIEQGVSAYGVGYGGRLEVGLFHLGLAGHYGKGLGLNYALEDSPTSYNQMNQARTFDGYSAFLQLVFGRLDVNLSAGMSRVLLLPSDQADPTSSLIKRQLGESLVLVYHFTSHFHASVEYMHGDFAWFLGEKQLVNFASTGVTATW